MSKSKSGNSFMLLIGTLFGAGYLPKAPGTWGSLLFLPFIYASYLLGGYTGLILLTITASILSLISAPAAIQRLGPDPGEFVMDECAGQALVFALYLPLFGLELTMLHLMAGFIFFRLFDITKPLGIKAVEKLRGKYGILYDDLLAGFYASLSLTAIMYISTLI